MNAANGPSMAAVEIKINLRTDAADEFAGWSADLVRTISRYPGFLSIETIPLFPDSTQWRVILQFRSAEELLRWRQADERRQLIAALAPLREGGRLDEPDEEEAPDFHSVGTVTEVITTHVKPSEADAFHAWSARIQTAQGRFPGYMGTYVQAAPSADQSYWTTLVRFSSPERLDAWLHSPERQDLLREADRLVESWESHRLQTPFAGWFPTSPNAPPPPAWKQTMLVLLVLFPVVMLEVRFLSPLLGSLNPALATFIGNAISVSLVSWPLMPLAVRGLGWWLRPRPAVPGRTEILGLAFLALLYGVELAALWRLL